MTASTPHRLNLAWAAGFIDGEGCVYIRNQTGAKTWKPYHTLSLQVSNTHLDSLEVLRSIFGVGHIHKRKKESNRKQKWEWTCTTRAAQSVLLSVYPLSVTKKKQIRLALDFLKMMDNTGRAKHRNPTWEDIAQRDAYYWALKEMK